ncbi:MAG TPA: NYN domain-containing protein [Vicinamibacterales bacterium]|nr:NYN domain-containing protein [Vicinamibacterales bacterium]
MNVEPRLKIAVFIDFDNIEIGVKNSLGGQFDIGPVLEALKERGEVVAKTAYSDWKRAGDHSRTLTQHAIKMVQRNLTPGGDKNGADINLALDALEMAFTHPHINAYVIVGGDSDFITLVEKLKQYDKKVLVVGGRSFTSQVLQRNCHEFIAYENLTGVNGRRQQDRGGRPTGRETQQAPLEQIFPLVRRALKVLADREVSPQLGLLKSTLLQLDSTFSERSYGAGTFRDFAERLEKAGLVTLKIAGRNILVELKDDERAARMPVVVDTNTETLESAEGGEGAETAQTYASLPAPDPARQAEGIEVVRRLLSESQALRFPMYVRNVKQVLRQANGSFDERTYGFAGLMDLLRACQRDGVLRMERDRRGALRVFPGSQIPAPARATTPSSSQVIEGEVDEAATPSDQPAPQELPESTDVPGFADFGAVEEDESSAHITDTTAEMLARAAAGDKTPRGRKPAGGSGRGRRTGARTASNRPGRPRPRRGSSE